MDTQARTLVKSLIWTVVGIVMMTGVVALFTGSLTLGGGMAAVNALVGFVSYLLYERVWAGIPWGRHV